MNAEDLEEGILLRFRYDDEGKNLNIKFLVLDTPIYPVEAIRLFNVTFSKVETWHFVNVMMFLEKVW